MPENGSISVLYLHLMDWLAIWSPPTTGVNYKSDSKTASHGHESGPLFTKRMSSFGYWNPHYKPKTCWWPFHIYNWNPFTNKRKSSWNRCASAFAEYKLLCFVWSHLAKSEMMIADITKILCLSIDWYLACLKSLKRSLSLWLKILWIYQSLSYTISYTYLIRGASKCTTWMFLASSCSCLCAIYWRQVLNWEWRHSWSSADRRCSNYIWVINNCIAWGVPYIRCLMPHWQVQWKRGNTKIYVHLFIEPEEWIIMFK